MIVKGNTMSEQNFKIVLDALWAGFSASVNLIEAFESIGLFMEPSDESKCSLYASQDAFSRAVADIFMVDDSKNRDDLMQRMDELLAKAHEMYPESRVFPADFYDRLISLVKKMTHKMVPWERYDIDESSDDGKGRLSACAEEVDMDTMAVCMEMEERLHKYL